MRLYFYRRGDRMKNTSLGYHTFAFFQKAAEDEFSCLTSDFIAYANRNKEIKRFPMKNDMGWEYTYEIKKEYGGNCCRLRKKIVFLCKESWL